MLKKNFLFYYSFILVVIFIVAGNCLTFNFAERLPLKLAEILAIPFIIMYVIKNKGYIPTFGRFDKTILIWLTLGTFSAVLSTIIYEFNISELMYGISYAIRMLYLLIIAKFVSAEFRKNNVDVFLLLEKLYVAVCLIGFLQLMLYPNALDFYRLFYNFGVYHPNPDPHIGRLISTYFDPNFLASCLIIPFTIALNIWKQTNSKKQLVLIVVYLITIILTNSRSGFLGVCVVVAISVFINKNKKEFIKSLKIGALSVFGLATMFFTSSALIEKILSTSSDASAGARFRSWELGFKIISNNPIIGIGYNMTGAYLGEVMNQNIALATGYGNDSSLLLILISTGIIGFGYIVYKTIAFVLNKREAYTLNRLIMIEIIISSIIICNFNNLLFYPLWLFPILILFNYKYGYIVNMQSPQNTHQGANNENNLH